MATVLTPIEARILGSLVEKQITTPEYYPLTLHSLTTACSQKNNREPVMALDETAVSAGLETLREKHLVTTVTGAGLRVPKYRHALDEALSLSRPETVLLCVLFLRGPQTAGELRSHTTAMYSFESLADVETTLNSLAGRQPVPLVAKLPRQAGQKERRFSHLLFSGNADAATETAAGPEGSTEPEDRRISRLEEQLRLQEQLIENLRLELEEIRRRLPPS